MNCINQSLHSGPLQFTIQLAPYSHIYSLSLPVFLSLSLSRPLAFHYLFSFSFPFFPSVSPSLSAEPLYLLIFPRFCFDPPSAWMMNSQLMKSTCTENEKLLKRITVKPLPSSLSPSTDPSPPCSFHPSSLNSSSSVSSLFSFFFLLLFHSFPLPTPFFFPQFNIYLSSTPLECQQRESKYRPSFLPSLPLVTLLNGLCYCNELVIYGCGAPGLFIITYHVLLGRLWAHVLLGHTHVREPKIL